MRKVILPFLISFLLLTLVSCTNDSDRDNVVLLKKLTAVSMGQNAEYNFQYNGTQLKKVTFAIEAQTDGEGYDKYTYTNNLITEIKRYNTFNQNTYITYFSYNTNNQLSEVVRLELSNHYGIRKVFSHNLDGTVTVTAFSGNLDVQDTPVDMVETYYFQNGEVSQKDFTSNGFDFTVYYSYDTANNPMKNVTGFNAVKLYNFISAGLFGIEHNVVQTITVTGADTVQVDLEAEYNTQNYPMALFSNTGEYQYHFEYFK